MHIAAGILMENLIQMSHLSPPASQPLIAHSSPSLISHRVTTVPATETYMPNRRRMATATAPSRATRTSTERESWLIVAMPATILARDMPDGVVRAQRRRRWRHKLAQEDIRGTTSKRDHRTRQQPVTTNNAGLTLRFALFFAFLFKCPQFSQSRPLRYIF